MFPPPRIVVSRCLGFDHCRYDGSVIPDPVVDSLRAWVDFLPVCPEVEVGLGAPRPPVRLVRVDGEVRLLQPATGRDLTEAMRAFAASFLDALPPVDGFILKNRSPSCGLKDAKVYAAPEKAPALGAGPGMFGGAVREHFPDLPAEDEGRLTNRAIREHFFTAIFALARLREVVDSGQMGALVDFHTRRKFLLMTYNQARLRELGRVVANPQRKPVREVMAEYVAGFRVALARPPRRCQRPHTRPGPPLQGAQFGGEGVLPGPADGVPGGTAAPEHAGGGPAGLDSPLRGAVPFRTGLLLAVPGGAAFSAGFRTRYSISIRRE